MIGQRRVGAFKQAVSKPTRIPGPETNPFYWNPNRVGAYEAPAAFRAKLKEVDPDGLISVNWNPVDEKWGVFYRKPSFAHKICQGWVLLFQVPPRDLDERVLARLYSASAARWGNGRQYFAAIQREFERDQERKEMRLKNEAIDQAMPFWEHSRISTAGKGNKFSTYHS